MADQVGPSLRTLSEEEFNTIQKHVIESAPEHLSEEEFNRYAAPMMANAIAVAEHSPKPVDGSAVGRFLSSAWNMVSPVAAVQGVAHAVMDPVGTVKAIGHDMLDQAGQAVDAAKQGRYVEAAGHGAASLLPIVGPAAARTGEQIAQGDIAGGLGSAAGLVGPVVAIPAAKAVGRTVSAVAPRAAEAAATALESGAASRVADVMAPKVGANKTRFGAMAEKIAPSLAKMPDGAPWSREGLHEQIGARLEAATQALDDAANTRLSASAVDTKPIIDSLKAKRDKLTAQAVQGSQSTRTATTSTSPILGPNGQPLTVTTMKSAPIGQNVVPGPNAARVAEIDRAIAEIQALGPTTRYEPLRRIREAYDGPAKAVYAPSVTADYLKAQGGKMGAADVTGTLRDALAKLDPETAKANSDYSLYRKADDILNATKEVERTRPKVGRQIMARLTGALVGKEAAGVPGAAAGFVLGPVLDAAVSSGMTTKLKTARIMSRMAEEIRRGNAGSVANLQSQLVTLARQAATVEATSPSESQRTPELATSPQ